MNCMPSPQMDISQRHNIFRFCVYPSFYFSLVLVRTIDMPANVALRLNDWVAGPYHEQVRVEAGRQGGQFEVTPYDPGAADPGVNQLRESGYPYRLLISTTILPHIVLSLLRNKADTLKFRTRLHMMGVQ